MSILFRALTLLTIALAAPQSAAAALTVYDIRAGKQDDATRVVIESSTPVNAQILDGSQATISLGPFTYNGEPPRPHSSTGIQDVVINGNAGTITLRFKESVRLARNFSLNSVNHDRAKRLVFDFKTSGASISSQKNATIAMPVQQQWDEKTLDPPQVLGQIRNKRATPAPVTRVDVDPAMAPPPIPPITPATPVAEPERPSVLTRDARRQDDPMRITIDAGHGGKDPGAMSPAGLREKDITLAMAKALANELENRGYVVFLTRSTDSFIPLRERVSIGRRNKSDLFISVHADSMGNKNRAAHGASVYTLSDVASDKESAQLAARENQVDVLAGIDLSHEDKDVANILIDLAVRDNMNQSKKLANSLVSEFNSAGLPTLNPAHRFAGFAVLKAADVPSILIELGFLSNPDEAELLGTPAYRSRLARAIAETVDVYARKHRPRN